MDIEILSALATPLILIGILVAIKAGFNEVIKGLEAIHRALLSDSH